MKKLALFFILCFSVVSILAFYSCSFEGSETPTNSSNENEFSDMVLPNYDDIIWDDVAGGTIEEEFTVKSYSNSKESGIQCGDDNGRGKGDNDHEKRGCAYGTILHQLDLTKDQKHQVFQFKKDFHDCVNDARRFYQHEKGLALKNAHQLRKDIIHQWKNGDISKEDAISQLNDLKANTKQEIENLKASFKAAVADCLCTFLKNIVSVLDDAQRETFITWVENNNCIDIECDLRGNNNNF